MAQGDVTVFDKALEWMFDGGWAASDDIKICLITNATAPTQSDASPVKGTYTECGTGGNYTGPVTLNTWTNMVTQASNVMTFDDTDAYIEWLQDGSNPTTARYALIYNDTDTTGPDRCICFVDLGAVIDMTAGDLRITWHANGIFTVTN